MATVAASAGRALLTERFRRVRLASVEMCRPLAPEDYRLQPSDEVSPPWWNLGHTSWFFVRNVLCPFGGRMETEDAAFDYLLNSYYAALGPRLPRGARGSISRPTTAEIYRYRASVDRRVEDLVKSIADDRLGDLAYLLTIGIQHEQQHQELFFTEIKCIAAQNPPRLRQPYASGTASRRAVWPCRQGRFVPIEGGLLEFGHRGEGWCWDNELPLHKYYLPPFVLADRLVSNGQYLEFIDDGGYADPLLWLDNGWGQVQQHGWRAPLYWEQLDGRWSLWTLHGQRPLAAEEPVCHVSFYEADAFARWKSRNFADSRDARLPSEREWEHAARLLPPEPGEDAFLESALLHPATPHGEQPWADMTGQLWQWTASYYEPYPGYRPFPGALAEYNGKFMDNQRVLRGGSCVTPRNHFRVSYRNFWAAATRFQFTGIRLARNCEE